MGVGPGIDLEREPVHTRVAGILVERCGDADADDGDEGRDPRRERNVHVLRGKQHEAARGHDAHAQCDGEQLE